MEVSGETGGYQLKPVGGAKLWWSIMGVVAVLLLIPVALNAVVAAKPADDYRALTLDAFGLDWEIPVVTESGEPVMCELSADDLIMKTWWCNGDTTVVTLLVENAEDPANTLQRMIRMGLVMEVPADTPAQASADGTAHLMHIPGSVEEDSTGMSLYTMPVVALSQRGSGEGEHLSAVAVIRGGSAEYYAGHIWSSMAVERGLPYQQELPVEIVDPWEMLQPGPGDLPFDIEDYLDEFLGPDHGVPDHGVPGYGGVGAGTAELARAAGGVEEVLS